MSKPNHPAQFISTQLNLPFLWDEYSLRSSLTKMLSSDIGLTLTNNRTSMLSIKKGGERPSLRIHRIFLEADESVIQAGFATLSETEDRRVRLFRPSSVSTAVHLKSQAVRKNTSQNRRGLPCLATLYDKVNTEYFQGEISAAITLGRNWPEESAVV